MEKRNIKRFWFVLLIILVLCLITLGSSVAFFSYIKNGNVESSIKLGDITFKYVENTQLGNGITLTDAFPISDEDGKLLEGEGKIFDFKVEANLSRSDLEYEIVADVIVGSTLPLDAIKFYLTDITNEDQKEIMSTLHSDGIVKTLDEFPETEIEGTTGKTIYQETILKNTRGYSKHFRARMWINEEIDWSDNGYMNTSGSVRINVYANSDRSMASTDTTNPNDTRIERVVANKKYLFSSVVEEQYQYTVTVPNELDIVDIDVIPTNTGVTAEVTPINNGYELVVGENYFKAKVISDNKEKSKEYILRVVREQSKNTGLNNLEVVGHSLSPVYSDLNDYYEVEVPYEVGQVEIKAAKKEEVQRIEGIGIYELEVGSNIIPVKIIAEDGITREIRITVNRQLSDDAGIENVGVTGYTFTHMENNIYSVTVDYEIESVEVTNISKTGASVSGTGIKQSLKVGNNDYEVTVTSASGKNENLYIIRVIREKDTDNTLASLELTNCTLTPSFSSGTASYQCTVENNITKTVVSASATSKEAKVSGTGEKNLIVGNNTIDVVVTAQNGENRTYEIVVTRKASNDATLKGITVSSGTLSPAFSPTVTDYIVSVAYNVESIIVGVTKNHEKASVSGEGNKLLNVGKNTVEIIVTAEDGSQKTYTVQITREKDTDNTLKSLELSDCILTPSFSSRTTSYQCTVANNITKTIVSASATSKEAKVSGTGEKTLNVGDNTVSVVVTAQDNSTNTYTVVVHRKSDDATLRALSITGQTISPTFNSGTTSYTLTVPNATSSITVNATKNHSNASVTGIGNQELTEGSNLINVKVTAEDGNTKIYTITVKRMKKDTITLSAKSTTYTGSAITANTASATSKSNITYTYYSTTDCSGTALSGAPTNVGNYSVKAVSAGNTDYESANKCVTHTITKGTPTINLTAKSVEATGSAITANTATGKNPNGSSVSLSYTYTYYATTDCSGTALSGAPTNVGNYSVKATSTATTNLNSGNKCVTHTITKNTNTNLSSLSVSGYSISPNFAAETQNYTLTVEASSITVNAKTASGLSMVSGTGTKTLNWGSNELSVIVTSQSGALKTYKITVTNQRPTAPTITGGSSNWVSTAPTISVSKAGGALSGVKHYEYYKSTTNTAPNDSTTATGTTSGNLTVSDEGTSYVWYRTVSNNGNKSVWTGPQVINLDTKVPTITINSKLPASVTKGDSYTVLGNYIADGPSKGSASCSSNLSGTITNTNQLTITGNHTITCTVTTGSNKKVSVSKVVTITYDPYNITNLVVNGSFENGLNGWTNLIDVSLSNKFSLNGNYSLSLNFPSNNGLNNMSTQTISQKPIFHHKYYGKIYYYSEYFQTIYTRFEWIYMDNMSNPIGKGLLLFTSFYDNPPVKSWFSESSVLEITDGTYLNQEWMIRNFSIQNSYPIYADSLIMIDLTETFGVGNEPDKDWCDRHINYFDGSSIIYK